MPAREISKGSGLWLATTPPTLMQRRLTLAAMGVLFLAFIAAVLLANVPLGESVGFVPSIEAIMFVTELVTATFLFTQFAIIRSRGILVLASGYLFTSLIIIAHALAFPGAFGSNGLFSAGLQTSGWLAIIWHFAFPVSVIVYVLMKDSTTDTAQVQTSAKLAICWSAAIVFVLVFALTWGLIMADAYVPHLFLDKTTFAPLTTQTGLMDALICTLAFFLLWLRQRSFLDRWLMIAVLAMILEMALLLIVPTRFAAGWYIGRMFGVVASTAVLVAFVIEGTVLYSRVANAMVLLQRERANRLMSLDAATSAMAHELRQPLTAIVTMSAAASNWLTRVPPDFEQLSICIASIADAGHRANDIILSVRELFKKKDDHRAWIRVDEIVRQVLSLLERDLRTNQISIETDLRYIPEIHADPTQLQQVIMNVVRNAIEAMGSTHSRAKRLRVETRLDGQSSVLLSVGDTGVGISSEDARRVFEPFFTTKSGGMGLGLSICKTIVEYHGGSLRLAKTDSEGCIFEIALPIACNQ